MIQITRKLLREWDAARDAARAAQIEDCKVVIRKLMEQCDH